MPGPSGLVLRADSHIDFYVDESSQNNHRYLTLGVLSLYRKHAAEILQEFSELREEYNLNGEMKWTKVTDNKFQAYRDWVHLFFKFAMTRQVRFQAMVVDTATFDHKTYNDGDSEIGFNKLLYQLLLHRIGKRYSGIDPLHGYLDSRTTRHQPETLRKMLNAGLAKQYRIDTQPFRRLVFRDSKDCDIIQTVDILTGAIAFDRNGHGEKSGSRQSKKDLSSMILAEAARKPICWQFSIWDFEFKNRGPQA